MPGSALPAGPRTAPKALYSGSRLSITLNTASCKATSIICPGPPCTLRWYSAISTPITPCSAASVSPMLTPQRTGTRPGSPVRWRSPPIASPMHAEARQVAVGPGLAVAADAQHHQARVQRVQRVPAQAPAFQRAGTEVLDQHVGLPISWRARSWPSAARRSSAIERLLRDCTCHHTEVPSCSSRQLAQRVAAFGRLDLDDVGAEVGQRLGGKGPGDQLAHLDDAQALQARP
jgi:hypothetical protein